MHLTRRNCGSSDAFGLKNLQKRPRPLQSVGSGMDTKIRHVTTLTVSVAELPEKNFRSDTYNTTVIATTLLTGGILSSNYY